MKPWLKNRNDRSACVNIFSEILLPDKFWHCLRMDATRTWIFLYHTYIYTAYIDYFIIYCFSQFTTVHAFHFKK